MRVTVPDFSLLTKIHDAALTESESASVAARRSRGAGRLKRSSFFGEVAPVE
jgi:hypothetical protein